MLKRPWVDFEMQIIDSCDTIYTCTGLMRYYKYRKVVKDLKIGLKLIVHIVNVVVVIGSLLFRVFFGLTIVVLSLLPVCMHHIRQIQHNITFVRFTSQHARVIVSSGYTTPSC